MVSKKYKIISVQFPQENVDMCPLGRLETCAETHFKRNTIALNCECPKSNHMILRKQSRKRKHAVDSISILMKY